MHTHLVWTEIDLETVGHNIREMRRVTHSDAALMAVVKANAYGHGLVPVARQALKSGAAWLGVARLEEGVCLRQDGIGAPILIFGYTCPSKIPQAVRYDLAPTLFSVENARAAAAAVPGGRRLKVHLKVDTGMGRLGMVPDCWQVPTFILKPRTLMGEVEAILRLPGLAVEGIYTHFATADSCDKTYAEEQFQRFGDILAELDGRGIQFPLRHAANSAAIMEMPQTHLDLVRAGIAIYGLYPSAEVDQTRVDLRPAMTFKTRIIQLKQVPAGFRVSYGNTFVTRASTLLATVPAGYADGFNRLLSSRGHVLVRGKRAPIVGRICMDQSVIDVGHIPGVSLEDEVVVFGRQEETSISADEIADHLGTISYEVVCMVSSRVPRIYPDLQRLSP